MMPEELLSKCKSQKWEAIKVVSGLKEGRGIFACRNIKKGEFICNYGGKNVTKSYADRKIMPFNKRCEYLIELEEYTLEGRILVYMDSDKKKEKTFGQLINHSALHPNAEPKVYSSKWNELDIVFISKRNIAKNEQILWDYGKNYSGVNDCVESCFRCEAKKREKRT